VTGADVGALLKKFKYVINSGEFGPSATQAIGHLPDKVALLSEIINSL